MSVRIYQLSKEIGLENGELIELLRERGFEVKSASSTVDNISAESLREEFANQKTSASDSDEAAPEPVAPEPPAAPDVASFVRSVGDIAKEKEEAKKAAVEAAAPKPVPAPVPAAPAPVAPPVPAAPKHAGPPPMAPPSGPSPVAPPPRQGSSGS